MNYFIFNANTQKNEVRKMLTADQIGKLELKLEFTDEEKELADKLHKEQCTYNHTDGCGYMYEAWDNIGWTRYRWAIKAREKLEAGGIDYFGKVN